MLGSILTLGIMSFFIYLFAISQSTFPRFCWGLLVPAGLVSLFVFGAWPLICTKIGLVNTKSHLDLIRDIKGVIEERREVRSIAAVTVEAASDSSSEDI
jgi:hypothetical protein